MTDQYSDIAGDDPLSRSQPVNKSAWAQMSPLLDGELQSDGAMFDADDVMLGVGVDADGAPSFEALADPSVLPVTVFPFLRQVSDRLAKHIAQDLRKKSGMLVDVAVIDQVNIRMGNAIASIPIPSLIGVMSPGDHDSVVFAVVDGAMAALFFDLLLGGAQIKSTLVPPARNFSAIEVKLYQIFVDGLVGATNSAFTPLAPIALKTDRVETNPRFLPNTKAQDSVIKIRLLVQCGSRSGFIDIYLSARFLTPIDARIRPSVNAELPLSDPQWQNHLRQELLKSHVELRANLSDIEIPLYRLRHLKAGDVLPLDKGPESLIDLMIDHHILARGRMGRSTGKIAIRVVERLQSHISRGE